MAIVFDEENQCIVRIINIVGLIENLMVLGCGRLLSLAITRPVQSHWRFLEFGMMVWHRLAIEFNEQTKGIVRIKPFGWLIDVFVRF